MECIRIFLEDGFLSLIWPLLFLSLSLVLVENARVLAARENTGVCWYYAKVLGPFILVEVTSVD